MDHARLAELQGPDSIFSGLSVEDWAEIASRSVQISFVKGKELLVQGDPGDMMLILTEGTVIDRPAARNEPAIPFFHGPAALAGWQRVIDEVHAAGGRMGPQLWHTGATRGNSGWAPPVPVESPSGLNGPDVQWRGDER